MEQEKIDLTIDNLDLSSRKNDDGTYVVVPKIIFNHDKLNASEKILYSIILSLSRNQYKESSASTKYLAKVSGLSIRMIQDYINSLKEKGFITWRKKGNKRFFTPLYWDKDAHAIITSDVMKRTSMTTPYKLAYGRLTALGWNNDHGGHNYDSMEDMANDLNVSTSSAYRYIAEFKSQSLIRRDNDVTCRYIPINKYSIANHKELKRKSAEAEKKLAEIKSVRIDDKADQVIDRIFKKI